MRGRARGSGDGEEKSLMKNEDFREQTAFSIYIVCLIKILIVVKGRSICPNPAIFCFVMHCVVVLSYFFFFCAIFEISLLFFFFLFLS